MDGPIETVLGEDTITIEGGDLTNRPSAVFSLHPYPLLSAAQTLF